MSHLLLMLLCFNECVYLSHSLLLSLCYYECVYMSQLLLLSLCYYECVYILHSLLLLLCYNYVYVDSGCTGYPFTCYFLFQKRHSSSKIILTCTSLVISPTLKLVIHYPAICSPCDLHLPRVASILLL